LQPLLTKQEYTKTKFAVSSFLASPLAAELQKRLKERATAPGVDIDWWNEAAYLFKLP
jgi:carnitine O-acetyltransferase